MLTTTRISCMKTEINKKRMKNILCRKKSDHFFTGVYILTIFRTSSYTLEIESGPFANNYMYGEECIREYHKELNNERHFVLYCNPIDHERRGKFPDFPDFNDIQNFQSQKIYIIVDVHLSLFRQ